MLCATEGILRRGGYSPIAATGPLEALKKSRDFGGEIHVLLTDLVMPVMDGVTLAQQIVSERPQIRVLLMSGTIVSSRLPLLKKPFRMHQLLEQVGSLISGPPPPPDQVQDLRSFALPTPKG
jgi:CheY-like chemotaxis protein